MDFEAIWYEYTPYLYAIAGIVFILHVGSIIGILFGLALIGAGVLIILLRHNYRKSNPDKNKHQIRSKAMQ